MKKNYRTQLIRATIMAKDNKTLKWTVLGAVTAIAEAWDCHITDNTKLPSESLDHCGGEYGRGRRTIECRAGTCTRGMGYAAIFTSSSHYIRRLLSVHLMM